MKKPFFSIITCTYNSDKYLKENLTSLASQSCRDFEHIFIDGGSTDNTLKLIKDYVKKYPGLARLYSAKPQGISHAMNEGIKKSHGQYLLHLHSDDYLHDPAVLHDVQSYLLEHPDLDWIYGQIQVIESDGRQVGIFPRHKIFQLGWRYLLKLLNFIPHQAVFIKRKTFDLHGGFNLSLRSAMDQDLWLRLNYKTRWQYIPRRVSCYRIHSGAMSSSSANYDINRVEYESVQSQYLHTPLDRALARLFHVIEKKMNQTTR